MLRPLIFRNFFRNIQNIKNGLRIKCYAPHPSAKLTPSPQGEGYVKGDNLKIKRFATVRYETGEACPPGGSLYKRLKLKF